jgi:choline dehydrogenase
MRPLSRGELTLRSKNPRDTPRLDPHYLEHPQDLEDYITAVRLTQEIIAQEAFDLYRGEPLSPGPDVQNDKALAEWIRTHTESAYHPCSTCAMGDDDNSVVDPDCRVHGVDALRVVDASIMPDEVSGNLNAPTIMIAEKAADKIRGRPALAPAKGVPVYEAPNWQTHQR